MVRPRRFLAARPPVSKCRDHAGRPLDRGAPVIEVQRPQAAELGTAAGPAGSAVRRLRHDVAVTGLGGGNVRRDDMNPAVDRRRLERRRGQHRLVAAVERGTRATCGHAGRAAARAQGRNTAAASRPARRLRGRAPCERRRHPRAPSSAPSRAIRSKMRSMPSSTAKWRRTRPRSATSVHAVDKASKRAGFARPSTVASAMAIPSKPTPSCTAIRWMSSRPLRAQLPVPVPGRVGAVVDAGR